MNDQLTNKRLLPARAIIVYHDKTKSNYYLESREIKKTGSNYSFMAPVPMSDTVMREIGKSYMKKNGVDMRFNGLIKEHILLTLNKTGITAVMWYRPSMIKKLNFSSQLRIKGESKVKIPAILYLVINAKLYVYALMDDSRPDGKTKLYNAPFFNIYEDGNVCLGTAPVGNRKATTFEGEAERFERGFYMAEQNGGQSRDNCKTPLTKLWSDLIKKQTAFPAKKELQQHKKFKTLDQLIDKLISKYLEDEEETFYEEDIDEDEDN